MIDRRHLDRLNATIAKHGHAIQYVAPCEPVSCAAQPHDAADAAAADVAEAPEALDEADSGPPFAYTIGLSQWPGRDYELAVTGQDPPSTGRILNGAATQLILEGLQPEEGLAVPGVLDGDRVLRLTRVRDPEELLVLPLYYPSPPPVWQLLVPDGLGRYPTDPTIQPLL